MNEKSKPAPEARTRETVLSEIDTAIKECGMEQLWHWGTMPVQQDGEPFMPADLPIEPRAPWASYSAAPASKWLVNGTIPGYWLCPGERRNVQEVALFRASMESLAEIRATVTTAPMDCAIRIDGKDEPFFGESWTLAFPHLPVIDDFLSPDHPLAGLNSRFMREKDPATLGILANQRANELRNRPPRGGWSSVDEILDKMHAEQAQAEAERLIAIGDQRTVSSAGEKLVPTTDAEWGLVETLEEPNMISVGASGDRLQLAQGAGVLKPAIDAAVTAGADNSLEKMLCHQMAAAHRGAMKMMQQGLTHGVPNVEATRAIVAAARLMLTFQSGMATLQKIKSGGKQTVIVKHVQVVQVGEGGQAVVTGKVNGRGEGAKETGGGGSK